MVPDNEIVVTKLENKCNFVSIFFVLMHFTGQKKKSIGVIHSVEHNTSCCFRCFLASLECKNHCEAASTKKRTAQEVAMMMNVVQKLKNMVMIERLQTLNIVLRIIMIDDSLNRSKSEEISVPVSFNER